MVAGVRVVARPKSEILPNTCAAVGRCAGLRARHGCMWRAQVSESKGAQCCERTRRKHAWCRVTTTVGGQLPAQAICVCKAAQTGRKAYVQTPALATRCAARTLETLRALPLQAVASAHRQVGAQAAAFPHFRLLVHWHLPRVQLLAARAFQHLQPHTAVQGDRKRAPGTPPM